MGFYFDYSNILRNGLGKFCLVNLKIAILNLLPFVFPCTIFMQTILSNVLYLLNKQLCNLLWSCVSILVVGALSLNPHQEACEDPTQISSHLWCVILKYSWISLIILTEKTYCSLFSDYKFVCREGSFWNSWHTIKLRLTWKI